MLNKIDKNTYIPITFLVAAFSISYFIFQHEKNNEITHLEVKKLEVRVDKLEKKDDFISEQLITSLTEIRKLVYSMKGKLETIEKRSRK